MQVVILCGGLGTRLREETEYRPKPLVPVGGRPILWHIMKHYAHYGHKEFILCLGYKGEQIKEYFRNYHWNTSDVTMKLGPQPQITYHNNHDEEDWTVTMVDTGDKTQTGGRLRRVLPFVREEEFFLTYGDGVSNVDLDALLRFHRDQDADATLTAVSPTGRFGELDLAEDHVRSFHEKPVAVKGMVNGGFFVMNKSVAPLLTGDDCVLEQAPFQTLAAQGGLAGYRHGGYWQCMDTYREALLLNELWEAGEAPWKVWR